jgi:hypothetical protein
MKNELSNKVADVSPVLPGEADDFNPFEAFVDEEDADSILDADGDYQVYLTERSSAILDELLAG